MFTAEMAKYQIQDRVREAEAARLAKAARKSDGPSAARRFTRSVAAALLRPVGEHRTVTQVRAAPIR